MIFRDSATALRLAHFFGSAEFWLTSQSLHELRLA
jgi:plasmid maintenance system antidote protein VapI